MRTSKLRFQDFEYLRGCKLDMLDKHLLECYNEFEDGCRVVDIDARIRAHRRLIHQLNLTGKNRYKTLVFLQQYKNTGNRKTGFSTFTNTLNKRGIFSKFLSDAERNNKNWNTKGKGVETGYSDC